MTDSLQELLKAATFKFSTSIAGLFSSIALSMLFRLYLINIESGFDNLCHQVESRVFYLSPQYITYRAYGIEQEQLHHLKEINDVQFFQRFGQAVGPALKSAVENAIAPLATKLDRTVDKTHFTRSAQSNFCAGTIPIALLDGHAFGVTDAPNGV